MAWMSSATMRFRTNIVSVIFVPLELESSVLLRKRLALHLLHDRYAMYTRVAETETVDSLMESRRKVSEKKQETRLGRLRCSDDDQE